MSHIYLLVHLINTNCQKSSKLKAHDSLTLLILSLFVQNDYRLLFLLWLLSFHILTALNVTSIKYDCKNVMRLRSVYLQILISSDGWCVSEWSHQDGGERKIASPVQGGHAQGADTKFMIWTSNIVAIQVTETKALIEKHYYRIDVIEKVLAKKAMEEEER